MLVIDIFDKSNCRDDWQARKLDVCLDVPDELDIRHLKAKGIQPGEEVLPESNDAAGPAIQVWGRV